MGGPGDFTGRCLRSAHVAARFEGARDLDTKVDRHRRGAMRGVMVQEDIVPARVQARLGSKELPNLIERGARGARDVADGDFTANGGEDARRDLVHGNGDVSHAVSYHDGAAAPHPGSSTSSLGCRGKPVTKPML